MPRDPDDDLLEEVLGQITDALQGLAADEELTRNTLREGLRHAFAAEGLLDDADPAPPSDIVVLDGGRADEDRTSDDGATPELHVAPDPTGERRPIPDIRVVRLDDLGLRTSGDSGPPAEASGSGVIRVRPAEDPRRPNWQSVFHGASLRTYRIHCVAGPLDVAADGEVVERLMAPQSIDVEARVIRVSAGGTSEGRGTYERVTD